MRKIICIMIFAMMIFFTGCADKQSNLSSDDMKVLNKSYAQFNTDDEVNFIKIQDKMNKHDWEVYGDKIKQIYIEQNSKNGGEKGKEIGETLYKSTKEKAIRKLEGKETEQDKKGAEEYNKNLAEEKELQGKYAGIVSIVNNQISELQKGKYKEVLVEGKAECNSQLKSFAITAKLKNTDNSLRVGQVVAVRNDLCSIVTDNMKKDNLLDKLENVNVIIYIDDKKVDTYKFTVGKGWDKEVKINY